MKPQQESIAYIRTQLQKRIGENVRLTAVRGRRKRSTHEGVIESVYDSLFTVLVEEHDIQQRQSYMFSDILTRSVLLCYTGKSVPVIGHTGSV